MEVYFLERENRDSGFDATTKKAAPYAFSHPSMIGIATSVMSNSHIRADKPVLAPVRAVGAAV